MIDLLYVIIGIGFVLSLFVQMWLRRTYARWSRIPNSLNLPGGEISRYLLEQNGMPNCRVTMQSGRLTDHYDPRSKTVCLSEPIYREPSIASAAIAAHETGHAMQDHSGYRPMRLRAKLLPIAQLGAQFGPWSAIVGGIVRSATLVQIGFLMFAAALVFQLMSLPIEFDASRRAKGQLEQMGLNTEQDRDGASKVLFAAAMTYVAGAATAMGQLLFVLFFAGRGLLRRKTLPSK
jgi:Zn-dependent membrane protease YugP